jgi:hypothetical protein
VSSVDRRLRQAQTQVAIAMRARDRRDDDRGGPA